MFEYPGGLPNLPVEPLEVGPALLGGAVALVAPLVIGAVASSYAPGRPVKGALIAVGVSLGLGLIAGALVGQTAKAAAKAAGAAAGATAGATLGAAAGRAMAGG